jgi:hypothetical protein
MKHLLREYSRAVLSPKLSSSKARNIRLSLGVQWGMVEETLEADMQLRNMAGWIAGKCLGAETERARQWCWSHTALVGADVVCSLLSRTVPLVGMAKWGAGLMSLMDGVSHSGSTVPPTNMGGEWLEGLAVRINVSKPWARQNGNLLRLYPGPSSAWHSELVDKVNAQIVR